MGRIFYALIIVLTITAIAGAEIFGVVPRSIELWPDGIVPFVFDESISNEDQAGILESMVEFSSQTKLEFRPINPQEVDNYPHGHLVVRSKYESCSANIGMRRGGVAYLNLQSPACLSKGTILHELGHVAGLDHEHKHPDRDKFLVVEKSLSDQLMQRAIYDFYGTELVQESAFDPESIMLYGASNLGLSPDGTGLISYDRKDFEPPVLSVQADKKHLFNILTETTLGEKTYHWHQTPQKLSKGDIAKINTLYKEQTLGRDSSRLQQDIKLLAESLNKQAFTHEFKGIKIRSHKLEGRFCQSPGTHKTEGDFSCYCQYKAANKDLPLIWQCYDTSNGNDGNPNSVHGFSCQVEGDIFKRIKRDFQCSCELADSRLSWQCIPNS